MADYLKLAEGLPTIKHTKETKRKLESLNGNKSAWGRRTLVEFARREGFNWLPITGKPDFVTCNQWQEYNEMQARSEQKKSNQDKIDYIYLIAFWWLRQKFDDLSASVILRRIILLS